MYFNLFVPTLCPAGRFQSKIVSLEVWAREFSWRNLKGTITPAVKSGLQAFGGWVLRYVYVSDVHSFGCAFRLVVFGVGRIFSILNVSRGLSPITDPTHPNVLKHSFYIQFGIVLCAVRTNKVEVRVRSPKAERQTLRQPPANILSLKFVFRVREVEEKESEGFRRQLGAICPRLKVALTLQNEMNVILVFLLSSLTSSK